MHDSGPVSAHDESQTPFDVDDSSGHIAPFTMAPRTPASATSPTHDSRLHGAPHEATAPRRRLVPWPIASTFCVEVPYFGSFTSSDANATMPPTRAHSTSKTASSAP